MTVIGMPTLGIIATTKTARPTPAMASRMPACSANGTSAPAHLTVLLDAKGGSVRDPQVHYDGAKILFSLRKAGEDFYHLYEIGVDGTGLRQLTSGPFDDYEATYLPDGGIAFVSTRCKRWVNCWMTQVGIIYRCDADGGNIQQLSANTEHDNTPWVLPDGRILYTRWEYVDRSQVEYPSSLDHEPGRHRRLGLSTATCIPGHVMIDAKPIPGTGKVLASFSPGHGANEHAGIATVVSPEAGPDSQAVSSCRAQRRAHARSLPGGRRLLPGGARQGHRSDGRQQAGSRRSTPTRDRANP